MGIYSHYSVDDLKGLRDQLTQTLHARLHQPTAAASGDRNVRFDQRIDAIRGEIAAVCAELDDRTGKHAHRPIYITRPR